MRIVRTKEDLAVERSRLEGRVGFVPTMGFLHAGHTSLIDASVSENDFTVVSIYVNPKQFGPNEDFHKYPRDIERDVGILRKHGVDLLFLPEELYDPTHETYVVNEKHDGIMCGKFRPGHFRGVLTVVLKLFNLVKPDVAYFGRKDAQQAFLIKRMVDDLDLSVKIRIMPVVRAPDGLALSSRNTYFSEKGRKDALVLYKSLSLAREMWKRGERDVRRVREAMERVLNEVEGKTEYIEFRDYATFEPVERLAENTLIAVAKWVEGVRLIDNVLIGSEDDVFASDESEIT
jgi:pantoate--beta-alanine ligase